MDKRTDQQLNKAAPLDFTGGIQPTEEESNYLSYLAGDVHDRAAAHEYKSSMFSPALFEQFEVPNIDQDAKKGNKFDNDGLQR